MPRQAVDMLGQRRGDFVVLSRAAKRGKHANWVCQHLRCGHETIVSGIRLRARPPVYCDYCRPPKRDEPKRWIPERRGILWSLDQLRCNHAPEAYALLEQLAQKEGLI